MRLARVSAMIALFAGAVAVAAPACGSGDDTGDDDDDIVDAQQSQFLPYLYVAVSDDSSAPTGGGMKLDAVALVEGGQTHYADQFHECTLGPYTGDATTLDCNMALGAPDNEAGTCSDSDTFYVSLGGEGGSIVVSFADLTEIEAGDTLRIYECGTPQEPYSVYVGTGNTLTDPNFVTCVSAATGVTECVVPTLPEIPAG